MSHCADNLTVTPLLLGEFCVPQERQPVSLAKQRPRLCVLCGLERLHYGLIAILLQSVRVCALLDWNHGRKLVGGDEHGQGARKQVPNVQAHRREGVGTQTQPQ